MRSRQLRRTVFLLAAAPLAVVPAAPGIAGQLHLQRERARPWSLLGLVGQGMANKQIARTLGIAERTVKVHLNSVFRQLGVADRTSAALWAREHLSST